MEDVSQKTKLNVFSKPHPKKDEPIFINMTEIPKKYIKVDGKMVFNPEYKIYRNNLDRKPTKKPTNANDVPIVDQVPSLATNRKEQRRERKELRRKHLQEKKRLRRKQRQ